MNVLASESSSGCESGWTLYLEHSHLSPNGNSHRNNTKFVDGNGVFCDEYKGKYCVKEDYEEEEEEEDLSMVSDASSGPPHFNEDEGYFNDDNNVCQYSASKATTTLAKNSGKKQKSKERRCFKDQNLPSFLDDTASSPVFNLSSKNNFALTNNQASMESVLDYSQGFSATQFQGRGAYQEHYGFLQSSLSGNQFQNNQWF